MGPIVYIDTEFTDLLRPELLSLGMVTFDAREHYVELDLADPSSASTIKRSSEFVKWGGVLEQWGRVPGSEATYAEMGARTARWLLDNATRFGQPAHIGFDYPADFELLERLMRDIGQWEFVGQLYRPLNVDEWSSRFDGTLGAANAYSQLSRRNLHPHHALADAHALRAACIAVQTGRRTRL